MPEITESDIERFLAVEQEFGTAYATEMREAELELRAKYDAEKLRELLAEGKAIKNANGEPSYPINDEDDLKKAIDAVGRGGASHEAIQAYIVKRAKAMNLTSLLPEDWRSADDDTERRAMETCSACDGSGKDPDGDGDCGVCDGTGEIEGQQQNSADPELERRKRVRELISGTVERRDFTASDVEIRTASDGSLRFSGYASTTETPYRVGGFEETFARGAFKRCLGEDPDVVLLINHEGIPLARTRSGTLTLSEDTRGLRVDAQLDPENPIVQTLVSPMKRGDMTEMSFAFRATDDEWSDGDRKRVVRAATIHKGDVSMVTHGANSATAGTITMRSAEGAFELRIDEERIGKALSNEKKAKLEKIQREIDDILGAPDEPAPDPVLPGVTLIPSGIEGARAARARAGRRVA